MGYAKHEKSDKKNYRNGYNDKTIKCKYGNIYVSIPRDRESSFEPQLVKNIATYSMLGITLEREKEIIGIWIGENETSKYWLTVLNDIKKRGVQDILIFAVDSLNGFNEAIKAVAKDLKSVYSAPIESLNATIKRKTKSKGSFPTEESA